MKKLNKGSSSSVIGGHSTSCGTLAAGFSHLHQGGASSTKVNGAHTVSASSVQQGNSAGGGVSRKQSFPRGLRHFSLRQLFYASPLLPSRGRSIVARGVSNSLRVKSSQSVFNSGQPSSTGQSGPSCSSLNTQRQDSSNHILAGQSVGGGRAERELSESQTTVDGEERFSGDYSRETRAGSVNEPISEDGFTVECPLCLCPLPAEYYPELSSCTHRSCYDCLQTYLRIEIMESRVNICCPECSECMHPTDIRMILNDEALMTKYEEFMIRRVLIPEADARWCPAPDCGFVVIASGCASCPKLHCERPGCQTFFCYHCKHEWHPNQTCDAARAQRSPHASANQDPSLKNDDIKPCPRCQILIVKMDDGSCNHMTCSVCSAEFCWLCMKEISDLHYLSPSGCTFWGKKPWSRKKKILWQLGTLVGAPVGIALIAGIAVPAMIIGIPVWVGRKLNAKYAKAPKHKRRLIITGGVTASLLISPVLAGLAVGIGVPILLAYIYGVVPISLCRSGGCGVTTSASGVRIEFDDEAEAVAAANNHNQADNQSMDTVSHNRVANPSIGEVSFGMSASISMGSGSHLERDGLTIRGNESDRESASNTAIAGASLTGSVNSQLMEKHRLDMGGDVASVTISLSDRSTTMSYADDASTRALAGSILSYKDRENSGFTPVEVHVDGSARHSGASGSRGDGDTVIDVGGGSDELGETLSLKTADEILAKYPRLQRTRLRSSTEKNRCPESEDSVSERVRFDDNVSFIYDQPYPEYTEDDQPASGASGCPSPSQSTSSFGSSGCRVVPCRSRPVDPDGVSVEVTDEVKKPKSNKLSMTKTSHLSLTIEGAEGLKGSSVVHKSLPCVWRESGLKTVGAREAGKQKLSY